MLGRTFHDNAFTTQGSRDGGGRRSTQPPAVSANPALGPHLRGPTTGARRARLRRSDPSAPGFSRARGAEGFTYLDPGGSDLSDPDQLERIGELAIPPAWQRVWISPDPMGHLQATGVDSAGRTQYLYHELWRVQQDRRKFTHMEQFAHVLPAMRATVLTSMSARKQLDREKVLGCAVRLLDVGLFRIGSEIYEHEDSHLGLATLAKRNVTVSSGEAVFDYIGKSGVHHVQAVRDPPTVAIVGALVRRRGGGEHLLAYRERGNWHPVHSELINIHLKGLIGAEFSAKNFRTWNATVLAAVSLAAQGRHAATQTARRRAINAAAAAVSEVLGNTPTVARRSYIDPRVFDRYLSGWTIAEELDRIAVVRGSDDDSRARLEHAVLDLLHDNRRSHSTEHFGTLSG
jgi:DNA topoisomerase-1